MFSEREYGWRNPSYHKGIDCQKVGDEVYSISDAPTIGEILDKASSEDTELHKCFEWDDTVAGNLYREQQCRVLLHEITYHVTIEKSDNSKEDVQVRAFVNVNKGTKQYEHVVKVFKNEVSYAKLVENAWNELRAFKKKYEMLTEFEEIFALIK